MIVVRAPLLEAPPLGIVFVDHHTPERPTLAYTLLLSEQPGHAYELAACGLPVGLALSVINGTAEQLRIEGLEPAEGLELDDVLSSNYTVRLRRVQDVTDFEGIDPARPLWQIVTPDKWGLFPGEPWYSDEGHPQPLP
ncbi:DUF4262 domain-containing protein [Streptomyces sp. NPDC004267]|uniref:DUF4262 domain-containing protein n=1 Tax=Streptomyces sp. NPDC004267 TaxID=3364694 RepID=UPI003677A30E